MDWFGVWTVCKVLLVAWLVLGPLFSLFLRREHAFPVAAFVAILFTPLFFESAKQHAFATQDPAVRIISETQVRELRDVWYADGNSGFEVRETEFEFHAGTMRVRGEPPLRTTPYWALRELELSGDRRTYLCEAYADRRGSCYPVIRLRQKA